METPFMNQIAAAIVILSATICVHISATHPAQDGFAGLMGLAGLGLGTWGGMSLLMSSIREHERTWDTPSRMPSISAAAVNGLRSLASSYTAGFPHRPDPGYFRLNPDVDSQVLAIAQLRGQDRQQVIEETLRRHLPRSAAGRVA
jgi:hypothetical protein